MLSPAPPASLPYSHPPSHYLWVSVKYASVILAPLLPMSGHLPPISDLRARHTGWDKPTPEHLKDIGTIEFFWRNLFEAIFHPAQGNWQYHWQQLYNLILERCPDNDERRTTIFYLETVKNCLKIEGDWTKYWKRILIYMENARDWARKSVIRG